MSDQASRGKGRSCNGDSGGPVFFKGTRVIAAVVSFGMNPPTHTTDEIAAGPASGSRSFRPRTG